jgi:hypothetical protein
MKLWQVYVALALIGFVGTGSQVLGYVDAGFVGANVDFWQDALTTHDAARFFVIDILVLGVAVFVFLGIEARRLGISTRWFVFYAVGSVLVGISTFVPLFLAHRQRRLDAVQG